MCDVSGIIALFPYRVISELNGALAVLPAEGHQQDIYTNPFISYNCLRHDERYAVVGNGTHADPVFEKLQSGMRLRDALASVLLAMDYEHDELSTPRIAAVADKTRRLAALGVIRKDGIEVSEFALQPGRYHYVSTYEKNSLLTGQGGTGLAVTSAREAADFIVRSGHFSEFTHPVSSASALESPDGFYSSSIN